MAQPVLSIFYFFYNGLLTSIIMGIEWDAYGKGRKGLRVSGIPRGAQRGTHFLQLPLRFAIPLALTSSLLHWTASQSLFAVSIIVDQHQSFFACGFSPLATICLLATLLAMLGYYACMAFSRFENGLPVAGNCSAAIAAACHPKASDEQLRKATALPLQWGVTRVRLGQDEIECSFWHKKVHLPKHSIRFESWRRVTRNALLEKGLLRRLVDQQLSRRSRGKMARVFAHFRRPWRGLKSWKERSYLPDDVELDREIRARVMYNAWGRSGIFWDLVQSLCHDRAVRNLQ
ncbi:hypothetical protein GTA08_BOTSDO09507 [Neofusicoccum parvum]|nr:hypothetical protein GTA08_BOTSDO09507 [Neofusicoccum parvum]